MDRRNPAGQQQLNTIRNMKFMQRKEEARRREVFDGQQREEMRHQALELTRGSNTERDRTGPTVLYENRFPTAEHVLGRRTFLAGLPETNPIVRPSDATVVINPWVEEEQPQRLSPAELRSAAKSSRYYVESSLRGPPLPRSLKAVTRTKRERDASADEYDGELY